MSLARRLAIVEDARTRRAAAECRAAWAAVAARLRAWAPTAEERAAGAAAHPTDPVVLAAFVATLDALLAPRVELATLRLALGNLARVAGGPPDLPAPQLLALMTANFAAQQAEVETLLAARGRTGRTA